MIWLAFPAFIFLLIRLIIVTVNLLSRQYLKPGIPDPKPLVSVLIPARNEEHHLPSLLDDILAQEYDSMEVIIYDDASDDRTGEIMESFAERDPRIKCLYGDGVPEGWNGKNNACHQMALKAEGSYFLFLDADVKLTPGLIGKGILHAVRHDLTLLSIFPVQLMHSFGEMLTVPVMNWILLSLLPLPMVKSSHYPSLSAANGQFMLFRAREYRQHRFHKLVRDINVEDIHIIRKVKKMGYLAQTLLSRGEISCRMYQSYGEGIFGFTRSMFAFFGGSGLTMFLFSLFSTMGPVFVWFGLSPGYALIYVSMSIIMRAFISFMSRQPLLFLLLLSPLIQLSFIWMVAQSFIMRARGKNSWKGREIKFKGI